MRPTPENSSPNTALEDPLVQSSEADSRGQASVTCSWSGQRAQESLCGRAPPSSGAGQGRAGGAARSGGPSCLEQ